MKGLSYTWRVFGIKLIMLLRSLYRGAHVIWTKCFVVLIFNIRHIKYKIKQNDCNYCNKNNLIISIKTLEFLHIILYSGVTLHIFVRYTRAIVSYSFRWDSFYDDNICHVLRSPSITVLTSFFFHVGALNF